MDAASGRMASTLALGDELVAVGVTAASTGASTLATSTLEDGDEIMDAVLAPSLGRSASPSAFGVAAASIEGPALTGTLDGNRRLNGSASAGGQRELRLASGEMVVVVVVVGGLIVEKWRKRRGM